MAGDDRAKRRGRFSRTDTSVPNAEIDPDDTPLPTSEDALARLWALRNLPEQLAAQQTALDGYIGQLERCCAQVEQWVPAINRCVAELDEATQRQAALEGGLDRFFKSEWPQLTTALTEFKASIRDLGDRMTKLESGMTHVGDKQSTQTRELTELETRVAKLERVDLDRTAVTKDRRKLIGLAYSVGVAAAAVIGWIAKHLLG